MKDGEFTCFDDILAKIKQLSEAEKCMITEIITLCKLLLVNPATRRLQNSPYFCVFKYARGERDWGETLKIRTARFAYVIFVRTQLIEWNGYETRQTPLLYHFDCINQ